MPTTPDPHAAFWAAFERKAGLTQPEAPRGYTRPILTAADGTPEEPLPTEIPKD